MVSYTLETLPPLTEKDLAELKALAARPDSENRPERSAGDDGEQWKQARRRHLHRPVMRQITARGDADGLEWLKGQGKGYQSRINAIWRREMLAAAKGRSFAGANDTPPCPTIKLSVEDGAPGS